MFFLFFKILNASFLKPLAIITSKKILFNSIANFFVIIELIATTPPNALIGSQARAFSKDLICFFSPEIPQGLACFIITAPSPFLKVFRTERAE